MSDFTFHHSFLHAFYVFRPVVSCSCRSPSACRRPLTFNSFSLDFCFVTYPTAKQKPGGREPFFVFLFFQSVPWLVFRAIPLLSWGFLAFPLLHFFTSHILAMFDYRVKHIDRSVAVMEQCCPSHSHWPGSNGRSGARTRAPTCATVVAQLLLLSGRSLPSFLTADHREVCHTDLQSSLQPVGI